jgi:catechol 2,3-dioxygenase-like lactoylglutathione lyase family enzyme
MQHTPIVDLDHITVRVRSIKNARRFYEAALGALGMKVNADFGASCGFGSKDQKVFWLARDRTASGNGHYAFRVKHRDEVDAFHEAALSAGGVDHGGPGPRPDYGRNYYAAFVLDQEGNNIEVVCYERGQARRPVARNGRAQRGARPS